VAHFSVKKPAHFWVKINTHWSSAARSTIQISKGSDLDGGVNFYVYIQTIIQDYALTKLT
jgi:hypothetical protein